MSTEHIIRWKCNRCGKTEDMLTPGIIPIDWKLIRVQDYFHSPMEYALCPNCADKLDDLLNDFVEGSADETD